MPKGNASSATMDARQAQLADEFFTYFYTEHISRSSAEPEHHVLRFCRGLIAGEQACLAAIGALGLYCSAAQAVL